MSSDKLHGDDTPVPVLARGWERPRPDGCGRMCEMIGQPGMERRRQCGFCYSPDRKGEHPKEHLTSFSGTLQADGYAGFGQIYETGRIQEAACWAHVRRKFYDLQATHKISGGGRSHRTHRGLYAIESEIPRTFTRRAA